MTVGTGGIAAGMGSPMQEEDDEMVDLDLGGEDELGGDELGGDELGDLGDDHDMDLGGGEDAIEVTCPSCNDTITVRLVPEVEEGGMGDMGDDMGDMDDHMDAMDHVDLDAEGEADFGDDLPVKDECMEGVDPKVIARLLTDDPDIFTK